MFRYFMYLLIPFLSFFAVGCTEKNEDPLPSLPEVVSPGTYGELKNVFAVYGYAWDTLDTGVPHLRLKNLPEDFNSISRLTEKKRAFFLTLLPMVLMANDEIREKRDLLDRLFSLYDSSMLLDSEQLAAVNSLSREYGLDENPLTSIACRRELMRRIDVIPPSMALAQAATESAYGTSRFALEGNNLFGEWTFTPGTGLVPKERPAGETYEVRRYDSLYDSVRSYMRNLNTHRAYSAFRARRAHLRSAGLPLQGIDLARNLENYSTRKGAYVEDIRSIIRLNHLSKLSTATLRASIPSPSQTPDASGAGLLSCRDCASRIRALREDPMVD